MAEALLAGDVPELEGQDGAGLPLDGLEEKVDADGGLVLAGEEVVDVTLENACLPDVALPDYENLDVKFDHFVVVVVNGHFYFSVPC